ncbi:MAG: GNAT family N-acetyltransferase [Myxococcota bacterium]
MSVTLRRATLRDRASVLAFQRALYLEHRASVMPEGLHVLYAYRRFEEVLQEDVTAMLRGQSEVLLAEDGEGPIGYVTGFVERDPRRVLSRRGIIGDWYVVPEARGRGIGRRLIDALVARFEAQGCAVLEMATWPFNTNTRRAIESMGFQEVQITYRRALGEDL